MIKEIIFFPKLERRENYHTKQNGEYYRYTSYKEEIRQDCLGRCVYCDIHENENGGAESMQLDHFRPQKYEEYKDLVDDPNNLVWSCRGCNRLKWDYWPAQGTNDTILGDEGFINPFQEDRQEYFEVTTDGTILPIKSPAKYMIEILALNRTTRKRIRELRLLKMAWIEELSTQTQNLQEIINAPNLTSEQKKVLERAIYSDRQIAERIALSINFNLY